MAEASSLTSEIAPKKSRIDRTIKFIVSGIFLIAVIEVFFRTVGFTDWRDMREVSFSKHKIYGSFQKSNLKIRRFNPKNYDVINTTNSFGFRDKEENFIERDLRGIWIAGGSNSYGGYVEDNETYSSQIENFGYNVANLSSESHFANSQAKVIRHLVTLGYRPQAIILELTLNNALFDMRPYLNDFEKPLNISSNKSKLKLINNKTAFKKFSDNINLAVSSSLPNWLEIKARLINNSATYGWLKIGINNISFLRQLTLKIGLRANVDLVRNAPVEVMRNMDNNPSEFLFDSTTEFVVKLNDWIRKNLNVPFGVVLIPSFRQLYPERFEKFVKFYGYQNLNLDPSLPLNKLREKLEEAGVKILDSSEHLMSSAEKELVFPDDGHLNARGHEIVSQAISDWLQNSLGVNPTK